jgi:hypothetical protein
LQSIMDLLVGLLLSALTLLIGSCIVGSILAALRAVGCRAAQRLPGRSRSALKSFYMATFNGGTGTACVGDWGTVFELTPSGQLTILWNFEGGSDGEFPLLLNSKSCSLKLVATSPI